MQQFAEDVMSEYRRGGRPFAVLVTDIDHFKRVNDTFGHAAGDDVIRHVATIVDESQRPSDLTARFGGEEFVSFLRDTPLLRAGEIADRIREAVSASNVAHGKDEITVTVSIGVAAVGPKDRDLQDVIERADVALYDAKASGRDRVSLRLDRSESARKAA
jgi:diguanylate cyclase (GGDEF)-like protein